MPAQVTISFDDENDGPGANSEDGFVVLRKTGNDPWDAGRGVQDSLYDLPIRTVEIGSSKNTPRLVPWIGRALDVLLGVIGRTRTVTAVDRNAERLGAHTLVFKSMDTRRPGRRLSRLSATRVSPRGRSRVVCCRHILEESP